MKAHRIELLIVDHGDYGIDEYKNIIEQHRHLSGAHVVESETIDIGEWSDDHPLNSRKTFVQEYNRLFKGIQPLPPIDPDDVSNLTWKPVPNHPNAEWASWGDRRHVPTAHTIRMREIKYPSVFVDETIPDFSALSQATYEPVKSLEEKFLGDVYLKLIGLYR